MVEGMVTERITTMSIFSSIGRAVFGGNEKPTQHNEYEAWQTFYNGLPVNENNEYVMTSEEEEQAALLTAQLLNPTAAQEDGESEDEERLPGGFLSRWFG